MTSRNSLVAIPVISTFAEADEVLKSRSVAQDRDIEVAKAPVLRGILGSLHGPAHLRRRRAESRVFSRAQLRYHESEVLDAALADSLRQVAMAGSPPAPVRVDDLSRLIKAVLLQVAAAIIGLDVAGDHAVERLLSQVDRIAAGRDQLWNLRDEESERITSEANHAWEEFLADFYWPSFRRRAELVAAHSAGGPGAPDLPPDIVTALLAEPDAIENAFDGEMIAYEVGGYLNASLNTTTHALPKAAVALLRWLEEHPEDAEIAADVDFVRSVTQESLRLYPSVPFLIRQALHDVVLSSGRRIPRDCLVRIDAYAVNTDPSVFGPNACAFDPHRRVPIPRPYGLSFGGGPHRCMGLELTLGTHTSPEGEPTVGLMGRVLQALVDAGIALDPEAQPILAANTIQHKLAAFPVLLTRL